jgi:5'-3' exonuclease
MTMGSFKRLIVLDAMAVLRLIHHQTERACLEPSEHDAYVLGCLQWMQAAAWIPLFRQSPEDNVTLWAVDSPPYWRAEILPGYKGDRPPKPDSLLKIIDMFLASDIPKVRSPGQEADDIAASIFRQWVNRREGSPFHQIFFGTVDNDWLPFTSEEGAYWLGLTRRSLPRVRQRREAFEWLERQWEKAPKKRVKNVWPMPEWENFDPRQIWDFKTILGEPGDCIPPPSKMPDGLDGGELINLDRVPEGYRLKSESWLQSAVRMAAAWQPTVDVEQFEREIRNEYNLTPPVEPLPIAPSTASTGLPQHPFAA